MKKPKIAAMIAGVVEKHVDGAFGGVAGFQPLEQPEGSLRRDRVALDDLAIEIFEAQRTMQVDPAYVRWCVSPPPSRRA